MIYSNRLSPLLPRQITLWLAFICVPKAKARDAAATEGVKPLEDAKPTKDVKSTKAMKLAASLKLTKED
jgi:hypothetical protein